MAEAANNKEPVPVVNMAQRLEKAAPYYLFMNKIPHVPEPKGSNSITFQDILDPSLGELESSCHLTFTLDLQWLIDEYERAKHGNKPMLIIYGMSRRLFEGPLRAKPNITAELFLASECCIHHSKVMLLGYTDGSIRVVIGTGNLYKDDWTCYMNGMWISPCCKPMPPGDRQAVGDSRTHFRSDLLRYLNAYNHPSLRPWIDRVRQCDFSAVNVFLIASVNGMFPDEPTGPPYGHARIRWLFERYLSPINSNVPIIAQSSAVGKFGTRAYNWLSEEFVGSFMLCPRVNIFNEPDLKVIYPSLQNVNKSNDGGGCLSYSETIHRDQPWITGIMHQWKADVTRRTRIMPHIKTYTRFHEDKLYWFLLTSANLSKSSWGIYTYGRLAMWNFELGVLFLPRLVIGADFFPMNQANSSNSTKVFPKFYDVPLTPYDVTDDLYRDFSPPDGSSSSEGEYERALFW